MHTTLHGSRKCLCASCHLHGHPRCRGGPFFDLSVPSPLFLSVCPLLSLALLVSHFYLDPDLNLFLHVVVATADNHCDFPRMRSLAPCPNSPLSQVMSPSSLTTSTTQETTEIIFQDYPATLVPSYLFDAELDDETIGRALSSQLSTSKTEKNRRTEDKLNHSL